MTTWAMTLGAAVLVLSAVLWSGAALACLLTGRTPPTAGLLTALSAIAHPTDPASVWPHPSALPGPVAYWTGTALATAVWVGVTWGTWRAWQRVATNDRGHASALRNLPGMAAPSDVHAAAGQRSLRTRAPVVRP
ncbi:hypothetical protein, partial [Cellulomonas sp. Root137]|uniref:hypothetical protein n=1 Tax=Cellulomonas sp. Root137 TaxID=1736459 RepID=UPI000AEAFE46